MLTTEDDDVFNVSASSTRTNLASLFGTSLTMQQNDNSSLIYNAPKNPKINIEETPKLKPAVPSSVMFTAFVDVYILGSDKNYTAQGKCGIAVIGNQNVKTYDVILYKSRQDIIMRRNLKSDFTFIIKEDNFATFSDDQKQEWMIHFKDFKEVTDFTDELRKHGANIVQGLGKVNIVETKSNNDNTITKESDAASDSSSTPSKASILSRMAKMGQPILPTNSQTKLDIKSNITDSGTDESETIKKPTIKKRHKVVTSYNDPVVKSSNQSNTTSEYVIVNGQLLPISSLQPAVSVIPSSFHNQLSYPSQLTINPPPQLTSVADPLNIFIAESRTHNCELRMNMTHLSSKLDTILAKIELPNRNIVSQNVNELQHTIVEKDKEIAEKRQLYEELQVQYNSLSKSANADQEAIGTCQQQIEQLKQKLTEQHLKINELSVLLQEQTLVTEQQLQIINTLNTTLDNLKSESSVSDDFNSEIERLNNCTKNLQNEIDNRNAKVDTFAKILKLSMNSMFQDIMQNFEDNDTYTGNYIKTIVSQKLKMSTLNIIQEFNRDFKDTAIHNDVNNLHNGEVFPPIPELL